MDFSIQHIMTFRLLFRILESMAFFDIEFIWKLFSNRGVFRFPEKKSWMWSHSMPDLHSRICEWVANFAHMWMFYLMFRICGRFIFEDLSNWSNWWKTNQQRDRSGPKKLLIRKVSWFISILVNLSLFRLI